MKTQILKNASVTLNASGAGTVQFQPQPGFNWRLDLISVSTSTATKHPTANILIDGMFVEGTYTGDSDSTDTSHLVPTGSTLTVTWTGGDVGATATARITGVQSTELSEVMV